MGFFGASLWSDLSWFREVKQRVSQRSKVGWSEVGYLSYEGYIECESGRLVVRFLMGKEFCLVN